MLKRIILAVIFMGILIVPVYADDHCAGKDTEGCGGDCAGACMGGMSDNPLDAKARAFIEDDVMMIAIMPFSDYSVKSPIESTSYLYWASRRIHDFMTAEFIKMGKLTVPYDSMFAALNEIRGNVMVGSSDKATKQFLGSQLDNLAVSSEGWSTAMQYVFKDSPTSMGMGGSGTQIVSLDLTPVEIMALGDALGVDAIFMGSISDYGVQKRIKSDARTWIPPFLGLWNPAEESQVRMLVYLYETETGQLIWASMEEVKYEPNFPIFSTHARNYEKLNKQLAQDIVDHFRDKPVDMRMYMVMDKHTWGPGDTRKEKDIHKVIRGEK